MVVAIAVVGVRTRFWPFARVTLTGVVVRWLLPTILWPSWALMIIVHLALCLDCRCGSNENGRWYWFPRVDWELGIKSGMSELAMSGSVGYGGELSNI